MDKQIKAKKYFDGTTDVEAFITITELNAAIKGYEGEKKAQYFASLLTEGPALNVYLRLTVDEKKNAETIKTALKAEFESAHRNREVALEKLSTRTLKENESPHTFAYSLSQLSKLAYASLPQGSQDTIARDHFIKGQSKDMQVALKSLPNFSTKSLTDLATETVRLQTAGIPLSSSSNLSVKCEVNEVTDTSIDNKTVDSIVEKVVEKLANLNASGNSNSVDYVQFSDHKDNRNPSYRGKGRYSRRGGNRNNSVRGTFNCRNCRSRSHGYAKCPTRFCQACGSRGHDAWSKDCPNF